MTAQFSDTICYAGEFYELIGISSDDPFELFDPKRFGISTFSNCTACWRGYVATYGLRDNRLVLEELGINVRNPEWEEELKRLRELKQIRRMTPPSRREPKPQPKPMKPGPHGPSINGVHPMSSAGYTAFSENYLNVGLPIPFTGGLLLGDGFIQKLYEHMGFHPAWKYEKVIELVFAKGVLIATHDRSAKMAKVREARARAKARAKGKPDSRFSSPEGMVGWIAGCFDRSY